MKGIRTPGPFQGPGRLIYSARSRLLPLASRRVPLLGVCNRARGGRRGSALQPLPRPVAQTGQTRSGLQFPAMATTPVPHGGDQTGTRGQLARELPFPIPDTGGPLGSPSRCAGQQRRAAEAGSGEGGGAAVRGGACYFPGGRGGAGRRTEWAGLSWCGGRGLEINGVRICGFWRRSFPRTFQVVVR